MFCEEESFDGVVGVDEGTAEVVGDDEGGIDNLRSWVAFIFTNEDFFVFIINDGALLLTGEEQCG